MPFLQCAFSDHYEVLIELLAVAIFVQGARVARRRPTRTMAAPLEAGAPRPHKELVKTVQLEGQVLLKIIQHCSEALPQLVTGQLLGLDVGQQLEVTDSFAFPVRSCVRVIMPGGH